jgi:hypothetical protein
MPLKLGLSFGQSRPKPKARPLRSEPYHAVTVVASRDACEAARAARCNRVLADKAPLLPLAQCDRPMHCACRYQHFEDRRSQPRRQADGAPPAASPVSADRERRDSVGRRSDDRLDFDDAVADEPEDHAETYFGFHGKS